MAARANDRETEWCVSGRTVNSYLHKLPRAHAADNAIAEKGARLDGRRSTLERAAPCSRACDAVGWAQVGD